METASSFPILFAVLAPTIAGLITLRIKPQVIGLRVAIAAAGPIIAFLLILQHLATHGIVDPNHAESTSVLHWVDTVHLNISFMVDGLGAFFALLVSGVGLLMVLYARSYFGKDQDELFRFYPTLGFFTTAMLGIVLADNMLLTVVFWEMTSISSFLLIGWERWDPHAVKKAMQAFFTTGLGGMAMFGGILLFGAHNDIWRWSSLLQWDLVVDSTNSWAFVLMFLGAATKSAQYPWHYWLPGAMVAPTPVSTFLHSATMVKAGVYLTARIFPVFSDLPIWPWLILIPGAITMLFGAWLALNQFDLKRIFAYTTVSQLGLLMCAYGLGSFSYSHGIDPATAEAGVHGGGAVHAALRAIDWDISQIANHAFYKAPLFILAGAIAHVAGTRELPKLFGFWKQHKIMALLMILAAYALAGGPGTISFPAKELFFYAIYHTFEIHWIFKVLAIMAVLTAMCNVAIFIRITTTLMGWRFGLKAAPEPEAGHDDHAHHHVLETGFWGVMLWFPAFALVIWQYVGGLCPPIWNAVFGPLETHMYYDAFAHGLPWVWQIHFGVPIMMSAIAISCGLLLGISPLMRRQIEDPHDKIYPALYWLAVVGGGKAFRVIQTGNFRHYILFVLFALMVGFSAAVYLDRDMLNVVGFDTMFEFLPGVMLGVVVCLSAIAMAIVEQRVVRVLFLGACGFAVVGIYLLYQAPDLALTQLMFELISVILFVLVLRLIPEPERKRYIPRWWRVGVAACIGLMMGWMTLLAAAAPTTPTLGNFFAAHSNQGTELTGGRGGGGNNIVNVVLVDFRGFDTLGEISVLSIAALGVWSLLPRRSRHPVDPDDLDSDSAGGLHMTNSTTGGAGGSEGGGGLMPAHSPDGPMEGGGNA